MRYPLLGLLTAAENFSLKCLHSLRVCNLVNIYISYIIYYSYVLVLGLRFGFSFGCFFFYIKKRKDIVVLTSMTDRHGSRFHTIRRIVGNFSFQLPPRNFITLHYAYFIGTCLVASLIFWGSSTPPRSVAYVDSLFLVVSAMTLAGLNTVNLSELNTFQQFILFVLTLLGSAILVSIVVVHVRKKAFERRFQSAAKDHQPEQSREQSPSKPEPAIDGVTVRGSVVEPPYQFFNEKNAMEETNPDIHPPAEKEDQRKTDNFLVEPRNSTDQIEQVGPVLDSDHERDTLADEDALSRRIAFASVVAPPTRATQHPRVFSMQGVGARRNIMNHPSQSSHIPYLKPSPTIPEVNTDQGGPLEFLPPAGFIERNSQFSSLTLAERDRLGGVEYRAIKLLAIIVPLYFILWQLLGSLGLAAYVARNRADTTLMNGLNPWYVRFAGQICS